MKMDKLKNKLINYSVEPGEMAWENIRRALDDNKQEISSPKKITRYLVPLAAAVVVFILCALFFINKNESPGQVSETDSGENEKNTVAFSSPDTSLLSSKQNDQSSNIISTEKITNDYITIASVDGKPVKISSKAATLILSSDDQYPPKAVWSAKVNKWKTRMLSNPVTPTTSNFLDIADLTEALDDQTNSDN